MIKSQISISKLQTDHKLQFPKFNFSNLIFGNCILFVTCNLFIGILCSGICFAKDINFEVSVDSNKVSLGSGVQLSLNFYGTQDIQAPDLPKIDGFDCKYLGPSSRMSIINGTVSSSITHMYMLVPLKVGTFSVPSFSVEFNGKTYTSKPIVIEVTGASTAGIANSSPAVAQNESLQVDPAQLKDKIFLTIQVDKNSVYVNEVIPLVIKLYINRLGVRDVQMPTFLHDGFQVDKFAEPKQYQETLAGILYDVIEFKTSVFATRDGNLKLGPAELKCNLIIKKQSNRKVRSLFDDDFFGGDVFGDFFGRYEAYPLSLSSPEIPIQILAMPQENKPENFNGALGKFQFNVEVSPQEVKVGDPITVKMIISGSGNFNSVNVPALNLGDNFKTYEPEIKQQDYSKVFNQVIIPKSDVITEVPAINFSFFDTVAGEYKTIVQGPFSIKVNPLPKGEELKVLSAPETKIESTLEQENLGRDIIYIKDSPGNIRFKSQSIYRNKLFMGLQFIPLLVIFLISLFQRQKDKLASDIGYARKVRASGKAKKNLLIVRNLLGSKDQIGFFDAVFKTLQEYLGDKFHLFSAGITANVIEDLKTQDLEEEVKVKIKNCFSKCDVARYAPSNITKEDMVNTFNLLEEIIELIEKKAKK